MATVIGLEIHVQLNTRSKLFCSCSTDFNAPANENVCPVCLGYPGTLPSLNAAAVEKALRVALALKCGIDTESRFERKNYIYPDLPKGYQITQQEKPLGKNGEFKAGQKRVKIQQVHIEEDAGKIVYGENYTLCLDYNRAGIPLIEIVTAPEISSPELAVEFLQELRLLLLYLGISDCNMEEGSLRCDANISMALGKGKSNEKVELKNMNSFRAIKKALDYEMARQKELLEKGERFDSETRTWDEKENKTVTLRKKGRGPGYRFMVEPDLPPLKLKDKRVENLQQDLPELPGVRRERLKKEYNLNAEEADLFVSRKTLGEFFEKAAKHAPPPLVKNWVKEELLRMLSETGIELEKIELKPYFLAQIIEAREEGRISSTQAREVFERSFSRGEEPEKIIEQKGYKQVNEKEVIGEFISEVMAENPGPVTDYKNGKKKAIQFLIGQVMKKSKGQANPEIVSRLLREKLEEGGDNV